MPRKSQGTSEGQSTKRIFERSEVQDRLNAEAAKLDAEYGGTHKFNNVRPFNGPDGANWTANFSARGNNRCLVDSVNLPEMRATLETVQAEMPQVRFDGS